MSTNHSLWIWSSMKTGSLENWCMQAYRILPFWVLTRFLVRWSHPEMTKTVLIIASVIYTYGWKVIGMLSLRCVLFPLVTDELKSGGSIGSELAGICRWRGLNGFQIWENWAIKVINPETFLSFLCTYKITKTASYIYVPVVARIASSFVLALCTDCLRHF